MTKIILVVFLLLSGNVIAQQTTSQDTLHLKEIVVTGTRNEIDLRHLPLSVSVINEEQIKNSYDQSLLPLLTEQVPGLFTTARGIMGYGVSGGGSGGMKMRGIGGSPTTGMLVLIDGHPQYMGLMGHSIADAYQSMLAERIEVVRGPASVLYGSNAMGGVINILTKKQKEDTLENNVRLGYGSYNTVQSEVNSSFRKKKLSTYISGSYNRTDGHRVNMNFEQYGGYAKVGYEFSDNWNAFTDVNITHYNASNPGMIDKPIYDNDSRITRGMTSLSLENNYDITSGALKLFYNWGHHNINDGYYEGQEPKDFLFDSKDIMFGLNLYQSISLFRGNKITLGFDYQQFGGKAWNLYQDGSEKELVDKTENNIAGYIDFRQSLGNIITLDAAMRFDHHSVTGNHIIPQFGMSIYPIESGSVKLIASKGFRNPTIKEMYMFPSQNPDLKPEQLWSYEVSWKQRLLTEKIVYEISLYYIDGENMIQTVPIDGRPMNINTGKIENWGVEFSTNYRISKLFSISANYSYLNMKNPIIAAPEHKLYAGVDFSKNRWRASLGTQYIDGLYTFITKDSNIQENFVLLNASVSYRISKQVEIYAKGDNLLNQKYEINLGFPMPGATIMGGVNIKF